MFIRVCGVVLVRVQKSLDDGLTAGAVGRTEEGLAGDVVSLGDWVSAIVLDVDGLTHCHAQL